ncbi:MAG: hypothetical protein WKG07_14255 [Hymenobacter sp.]
MAGLRPRRYLALNAGKFSVADYFDQNSYSHDPRTQFFNWSLMSAGSWDYPANVRGYTVGAVLEYIAPALALRAGIEAMPLDANGPTLDYTLRQGPGPDRGADQALHRGRPPRGGAPAGLPQPGRDGQLPPGRAGRRPRWPRRDGRARRPPHQVRLRA